jgi:hypothetical protein
MDPEFVRVTSRVMAVGLIVVTLGTLALFYAFRSFGEAKERQDFRPFAILLGAAFFILVCCVVLLRWSFAVR